ncbi:SRPBCC family protein [Saxibacter everestensis]|uniref:SRPBCC family protein n=1 Tax=Saxibacter everestensis TaxID=2909229 RepID=A0ABY8QR14_9MICO|nr:SRPBCC family protein [Brevibacteriaceae bacterium ZFBP1038]
MAVSFECSTRSTLSQQRLFDLSRDIDVHVDSMSDSGERAVAGVQKGLIGAGQQVTWRAWHFGLPLRMTSKITEMHEPDSFTDEQVRGPFRYFRHIHEVHPDGSGSVLIDRVSFAAPFGVLGRIVERLVLGSYIRRLIEKRNRFLRGVDDY